MCRSGASSGWQYAFVGYGPRCRMLAVLCLLCVGCSSAASNRGATGTETTAPGHATCAKPSLFGADGAAHEIRGTSSNGQLWGLALGPGHVPPRAGDELKIVWRMTGTGPMHVTFSAPDGTRRALVFGPVAHTGGSSYQRPGDEWGTEFRFSSSGCWHIHLTRADTSGDVWLSIPA
jgi:hypothetical protein